MQSPSESVRLRAPFILSQVKPCSREVMQVLLEGLEDSSDQVRSRTSYWLRELHEAAAPAVPAVAARLARETDPAVRTSLCLTLRDLALWAASAVDVLRSFAEEDNSAREALDLIEKLERSDLHELLGLLDDGRQEINRMTTIALRRFGEQRKGELISALIEKISSRLMASEGAVKLLGESGPAAKAAVPALRELLESSKPGMRRAAAEALHAIVPSVVTELGQGLTETQLSQLRAAGASPALIELVEKLLDYRFTGAAGTFLWNMAQLGGGARPVLPFIRNAMKKRWLRYDAAGALARIAPEEARPFIPELLGEFARAHLDDNFDLDCLRFLGYLGADLQPDAISFLMRYLPGPSASMIPTALGYLETASPEMLLPLITRLLTLQQGPTRTLKFLTQKGSKFAGAVPAVAHYLDGPLAPLALQTLHRIGSWTGVLPYLEGTLHSENDQVRAAVSECLNRLGRSASAEDVPSLHQAQTHFSPVVRLAAETALARLGDVAR